MPPETADLEPQQYARHFMEDDVPLADVRKSTLRRFVYIGCGLFALLMVAGSLIKFPDEISLPFVLKSDAPEDVYRFPYPVYLVEKFAVPGSNVAPGAALAKISSPEIVAMINSYEEAADAMANYRKRTPRYLGNQQEMLRIRMQQNNRRSAEAAGQLRLLSDTWKSNEERLKYELEDAGKKLEQNRKLYAGKYISAAELKDYEARQVKAADALLTARQNYTREYAALTASSGQNALENASLSRETEQAVIGAASDSLTLANRLALAKARLQNSFGDCEISGGNLILKAGAAGAVTFLFEGEKEVPASAILLKVAHPGAGLYAAVVSPPDVIGRLRREQAAFLKVATFPSYEWGAARGHIQSMSLTPDEKGAFNVRIGLDDPRKLAGMLQPGMNGVLAVQLEERTFFQYFFRNIRKGMAVVRGDG